jgi:hypothetical protein
VTPNFYPANAPRRSSLTPPFSPKGTASFPCHVRCWPCTGVIVVVKLFVLKCGHWRNDWVVIVVGSLNLIDRP